MDITSAGALFKRSSGKRCRVQVVDFISFERLGTFELKTERQDRAIALHNQTLQMGSSLMSMIALLELALRNSTNQRISEDFGDPDWLVPGHATVTLKEFEQNAIRTAVSHARKAAYAKLSYKEKSALDAQAFPDGIPAGMAHLAVARRRQSLFSVSHGQIISQTTLSFWKRLYSQDYETTLWKTSLKRVFPNKALRRSDLTRALETIYATRNRVAHHEPVYGERLDQAVSALDFVRTWLGAKTESEQTSFKQFSEVQYLRMRMDYQSHLQAWQTLT